MTESATESSIVADPQAGDIVAVRGKSWIVERAEKTGPLQTFHLVSCEDDSQGETIQLAFATELQTQVLDPNDWSPLSRVRAHPTYGRELVVAKAATLRDRERREAERFNRPPVHLGAGYWALHSLSHAFMAELALECGYPLSSLKERVYASGPSQPDRFGILIYTSTAGGQGTLGGLSNMAEWVGELLDRATKRLALCSNDPICAEHSNVSDDYP